MMANNGFELRLTDQKGKSRKNEDKIIKQSFTFGKDDIFSFNANDKVLIAIDAKEKQVAFANDFVEFLQKMTTEDLNGVDYVYMEDIRNFKMDMSGDVVFTFEGSKNYLFKIDAYHVYCKELESEKIEDKAIKWTESDVVYNIENENKPFDVNIPKNFCSLFLDNHIGITTKKDKSLQINSKFFSKLDDSEESSDKVNCLVKVKATPMTRDEKNYNKQDGSRARDLYLLRMDGVVYANVKGSMKKIDTVSIAPFGEDKYIVCIVDNESHENYGQFTIKQNEIEKLFKLTEIDPKNEQIDISSNNEFKVSIDSESEKKIIECKSLKYYCYKYESTYNLNTSFFVSKKLVKPDDNNSKIAIISFVNAVSSTNNVLNGTNQNKEEEAPDSEQTNESQQPIIEGGTTSEQTGSSVVVEVIPEVTGEDASNRGQGQNGGGANGDPIVSPTPPTPPAENNPQPNIYKDCLIAREECGNTMKYYFVKKTCDGKYERVDNTDYKSYKEAIKQREGEEREENLVYQSVTKGDDDYLAPENKFYSCLEGVMGDEKKSYKEAENDLKERKNQQNRIQSVRKEAVM